MARSWLGTHKFRKAVCAGFAAGKSKLLLFSASSSQNCSRDSSGRSLLLPAIIAALTPPIDVPATMSIFCNLLSANALKTPHPNAPSDPPPWSIRTFSSRSLAFLPADKAYAPPAIDLSIDKGLFSLTQTRSIFAFKRLVFWKSNKRNLPKQTRIVRERQIY